MEGEMISGAPRVVVDGGDQSGKVWKMLFVPQEADELDSAQFTVSVDIAVQQVCLKHPTALLRDGGAYPEAGYAGQWRLRQAVHFHDVHSVAQGAGFGDAVIKCAIADAAANFLPMADMPADAIGVAQQATYAFKVARGQRLAQVGA